MRRIRLGQPAGTQYSGDLLALVVVHLAAERLDAKGLHGAAPGRSKLDERDGVVRMNLAPP